jgi:predicted DNA-binding transcriptional regulator AlpA
MNGAVQVVQGRMAEMLPSSKVLALLTSDNLTPGEVASLLGVSRMTLDRWRLQRQGPPFMRLKLGVIVYPRNLFESYLRTHRPSAAPATGKQRAAHGGR